MTGRVTSDWAGPQVWAARWLTLALPLALLAPAAAAFALAPSGISHQASAGPYQGLLVPTPGASMPAPLRARSAITGTAVSRGERALSRPRHADQLRRAEP